MARRASPSRRKAGGSSASPARTSPEPGRAASARASSKSRPAPTKRRKLPTLSSSVKALRQRLTRRKPAAPKATAPVAAPVKSRSRVAQPSRVPAQRSPRRRQAPPGAGVPTPKVEGRPLSPAAPLRLQEEQFQLPGGYGDHKVVLLVRDPWWIFAYWEVDPHRERAARTQFLPEEVPGMESVLRVYNVTGVDYPSQPANSFFDISLSGLATNWYIHTNAPNSSFIVELGLRTGQGRFLMLVRSNRVNTPPDGPSDVIDGEWSVSDEAFTQLFNGPLTPGASPSEGWAKLVDHFSSSARSSGAIGAAARPPAMHGLWVRADTDLVVYGRTDPKAHLTIDGQAVPVKPDGSFRFRAALPEGSQTIAVTVTSPDGRQAHTITPVVSLQRTTADDRASRPARRADEPLAG